MRQATPRRFAAVIVVLGSLSPSISTTQQPQQTKSLRFEVAAIRPSNPPELGGVDSWSSIDPPGGLFFW